jgi:hypothetical protein
MGSAAVFTEKLPAPEPSRFRALMESGEVPVLRTVMDCVVAEVTLPNVSEPVTV